MTTYYNFTFDRFSTNGSYFTLEGAKCNGVDAVNISNPYDELVNSLFSCYGPRYREQIEEANNSTKSSSATTPPTPAYKLIIFMALLMIAQCASAMNITSAINLDTLRKRDLLNHEQGIDNIISSLPVGTVYTYDDFTVYGEVTDRNGTDSNIQKRCVVVGAICLPRCQTSRVTEKRMYRRGNWYGGWDRVSNCLESGLGRGGSIALSYSFSKTETHEAGFDINFGVDWINAHMGYSVSRTYSKSTTYTCDSDPGDWALSLWYSQHYIWMETQERVRTVYSADCHAGSVSYTGWGTTRHADIPISKQDGDMDEGKFGCSVNEAAEC
ncbi:DEHA2F27456p [Debaryomyces hansenii CBS767]|uniref:DEHA2F27456p n=1 Tax=Debaryomyces hansenii (strain ATCC 36239 / CBS 767 / BCRC 21394 / JCM 1990 / NBRC 0083 / IGC 2968) TaxID=284592 RepID=Q6BJT9_DEBHA|nr:DEHA2F27456p [Debaryomyces hansenii CBS767]CAG89965.2 DEHA2F27456p [Debaryomyces hansenii CBS767]|eukprot:XP_461532.2 DEHA2F27456p [Debaryomyces hansenii CBS767]